MRAWGALAFLCACGDHPPAGRDDAGVGLDASPEVDAGPGTHQLSVSVVGEGTVTAGAEVCDASCTYAIDAGAEVQLVAEAAPSWRFGAWSGDCAGTATSAAVVVDRDAACTATFEADPTYTATGVASPVGAATITATSAAGVCAASACSALPDGAEVTFDASTNQGYELASWSASCGGGATSTVTATVAGADLACTASYRVQVTGAVSGPGTATIDGVTTDPAGACTAAPVCAADPASAVTFTVQPDLGTQVAGWSGACAPHALDPERATLDPVGASPVSCTAELAVAWSVSMDQAATTDRGVAIREPVAGTLSVLASSTATGTPAVWLGTLDATTGAPTRSVLVGGDFASSPARGLAPVGEDHLALIASASKLPVVVRVSATDVVAFAHSLPISVAGYTTISDAPTSLIDSSDSNVRIASTLVLQATDASILQAARLSTITRAGVGVGDLIVCDATAAGGCGACTATSAVAATSAGAAGTILVTSSATAPDAFTVSLVSLAGLVTWASTLTLPSGRWPTVTSAIVLPGGDVAIAGLLREAAGVNRFDGFVVKLTSTGGPGFAGGTYGYTFGRTSGATALHETFDGLAPSGVAGGIVATGRATDATGGGDDGWLVDLAADGSIVGQTSYGSAASEVGAGVVPVVGGGHAIVGSTGASDVWAVRVSPALAIRFDPAAGWHTTPTGAGRGALAVSGTTNACMLTSARDLQVAAVEVSITPFAPVVTRATPGG